jgi:hypothetical protein
VEEPIYLTRESQSNNPEHRSGNCSTAGADSARVSAESFHAFFVYGVAASPANPQSPPFAISRSTRSRPAWDESPSESVAATAEPHLGKPEKET